MYEAVIERIEQYTKIVIHRHIDPDLDALGSQLGLKRVIENHWPDKAVRVVGDENDFAWLGAMDDVEDTFFEGALAIILDVSVKARVSDGRYRLAKEVVIIDHHLNEPDIDGVFVSDPTNVATCEMIVKMCRTHGLCVCDAAATALFAGLVGDSGRFLYPSTDVGTFDSAAFLLRCGADKDSIYASFYTEPLTVKRLRGHVLSNFKATPSGLAYMKHDKHLKEAYGVSTFRISRGTVNQMAGIEGVEVWANFTEDDDGRVHCEIRSRQRSVVELAKKYGGGGHALACGCILRDFDEADAVLEDLEKLVESGE